MVKFATRGLLVGVIEAERPPACVPLDMAGLLKASSES
jgi:hypothetical protein